MKLEFVDSAQQELDAISREPREFTHPIPSYQVLASQTNLEAEQNLETCFTTEDLSFKNAKSNMASTSTSAAVESESEDHDFTDVESEEEEGEEDAE